MTFDDSSAREGQSGSCWMDEVAALNGRIAALRAGLQRVGDTRASGADFPVCDACGNLTCNCPEACGGHVARATLLADDDKAAT